MPRGGTGWKEAGLDSSLTQEEREALQDGLIRQRGALEQEYGRRMACWNGWKDKGLVAYGPAYEVAGPNHCMPIYRIGALVLQENEIDLMNDVTWAKLVMAVTTLPK